MLESALDFRFLWFYYGLYLDFLKSTPFIEFIKSVIFGKCPGHLVYGARWKRHQLFKFPHFYLDIRYNDIKSLEIALKILMQHVNDIQKDLKASYCNILTGGMKICFTQ